MKIFGPKLIDMQDAIDRLLKQWKHERPDLDATPMGVVGRVLRLSLMLQARVEAVLKPLGLSLWQFDVLVTLRRNGEPYRMSPTALMHDVMLSSGAMTNRIDKLESMQLVQRLPDPDDRRGVLIELTEKGLALAERAIAVRFDEAREAVALLAPKERKAMEATLRTLILGLEQTQELKH